MEIKGSNLSRFNLPCSLQILNKELICQPEYHAVNQFDFNGALTDFEDLAMGELMWALFFLFTSLFLEVCNSEMSIFFRNLINKSLLQK